MHVRRKRSALSEGDLERLLSHSDTSKGQEAHLRLPFAIDAALGQENQIIDRLSDRGNGLYLEDPWHRLTCCDSIECVPCQRRDIVRDEDAPLVGGPLKD